MHITKIMFEYKRSNISNLKAHIVLSLTKEISFLFFIISNIRYRYGWKNFFWIHVILLQSHFLISTQFRLKVHLFQNYSNKTRSISMTYSFQSRIWIYRHNEFQSKQNTSEFYFPGEKNVYEFFTSLFVIAWINLNLLNFQTFEMNLINHLDL